MTSSSSGHSSDDRWYELLEPPENGNTLQTSTPPPLPARVINGPNSTFQSTPKQSQENIPQMTHSMSQIQISSPQKTNPTNNSNSNNNQSHTKLHATHSLPLSHGNYSLSVTSTPNHTRHQDFEHKISLKTSINDTRPLPRTANIEYLRTPKSNDYSMGNGKSPSLPHSSDGHSTDTSTSERLYGLPSEDELSAGSQSGNVSPKFRRSVKGKILFITLSLNSRLG